MGKRLPPGEAERRAKERAQATWSGANYKKYDPTSEGYGSYEQWAAAAAAFVNGDTFEAIEIKPAAASANTKKKPNNPDLILLNLDEMPIDMKVLKSAYRREVLFTYQQTGSSDTNPVYVEAFRKLTRAFDRIRIRQGL